MVSTDENEATRIQAENEVMVRHNGQQASLTRPAKRNGLDIKHSNPTVAAGARRLVAGASQSNED